jgi:putative MFS transporter
MAIGALLGGWFADRWGAGRMALISGTLLCIGVLGLIAANPTALWLVLVYVLAAGFGRGAIGVAAAVVQSRNFAGPALGRISGVLDLGWGVGSFAGPYLPAFTRDVTGSYAYGLATAIPAVVIVTTCILVGHLRPITPPPKSAAIRLD